MLKTKINKIVALSLIIIGIIALTYSAKLLIKRNTPVNFDGNSAVLQPLNGQKTPFLLEINSLGIKLPTSQKGITEGKWDDPEATVGYWADSPLPGETGNSVMYGHNWPNLLGNLYKIKKGDTISITFNDGTSVNFIVAATYTVTSDQKHILQPTDDVRLTIYTCTGFLDSKRFVVVAVPNN